MKKDFKITNNRNGCVVTEYWDSYPVRKHSYNVRYFGGDIIQFMSDNDRYKCSERTNFTALNMWLGL